MWKIFGLILACFLISATAEAAVRTPLQTAATAVGNGIPMTVDDKGAAGLTVTGTFVGTIAFEGSADGGTTWSALTCTEVASLTSSTTTTTTGQYQCPVAGLSHARARISNYTSGSITVVGTASNGSLGSIGAGGPGGVALEGTATAAAPTLAEGAAASFSFDLANNARFTMGTLLSAEDQPNSLFMVSGGAVRQTTVASAITTNTTSVAVSIFTGPMTIFGQVDGTGTVTATLELWGGFESAASTTNKVRLCAIWLTGTTTASDSCPPFTSPYPFYVVKSTNVTGTGATAKLLAGN